MPSATTPPPELEVLTFLSDPNAQVRRVALSNIVGFSAKDSPQRSLLISKHKNRDGSPLLGRDGKEVDTVEDLKRLCQDQPLTAHDAFSALINISDSLVLARKIGDKAFLEFLVRYIADPVSLLADLACMLLSNLTKLESICAILLDLQVQARPFYSFMASEEMEGALNGMDVEPNDPEYAAKKAKAEDYAKKVAEQAKKMDEKVPAMARLIDAFEEGATVASQGSDLEAMKQRAKDAATKAEEDKESGKVERGPDGRPRIKRKTNCNFLASVFANVTVLPRGRDWFVTPLSASSAAASATAQAALARGFDEQGAVPAATEYPVARVMAFTEHPNLIRRGGVISTLKNVLFVKSAHKLLVAPPPAREGEGEDEMLAGALRATWRPPSSIDILPYLLLPLCDGKELAEVDLEDQEELPEECQMLPEDKKRERDPALRLMLVESLLLLCTNLYGRQCLRARGAYVVVRSAHLVEADEKIAEAVLRLVNILKRDESAATAKDLEDDSQANEEDVAAEVQEDDESGDEDLQIEEL